MKRIHVGDYIEKTMPYSEVCVHLKVAGKRMRVRVLNAMSQVYTKEDIKVSFPITHGESGIFCDNEGLYTDDECVHIYHGVG